MSQLDGQSNNVVEIYGVKDFEHAKRFMTSMLNEAIPQLPSNLEPLRLNPRRQSSIWKLVTKYYEALVEVRHFCDFTPKPSHDSLSPEALATVLLWDTDDKDRLSSVLQCFSDSSSDSRLVIVQIEAQLLEDDDEWHEICSQYGFECHSAFDLGEASMTWQCCPWPSIQMKARTGSSSSTLNPLSELAHTPNSPSSNRSIEVDHPRNGYSSLKVPEGAESLIDENQIKAKLTDSDGSGEGEEEYGFEDDFSPFVSGEETNSLEWDYQNLSDEEEDNESIKSTDVKNMTRQLFGHTSNSSSNDQLGDLENLVSRIDQLKLDAANLDSRSRQRFAAQVALAVESHLCSN